jgi:hypothetical protein
MIPRRQWRPAPQAQPTDKFRRALSDLDADHGDGGRVRGHRDGSERA